MHSELKEKNKQQYQALDALLKKGRLIFGFPRELEQQYSLHVRKKILQRVPMVGLTSICFLMLFAVLDQFMLPTHLAHTTAVVRTLIVCPIIFIFCLWLYLKPPRFYLLLYSIAFLFVSLSAVWVIWFAHKAGALLPYEGLMITIMYGFVILGLPLFLACLLNAIVLCAYIFTEPFYILSFNTYVNNVMFLSAMYLAGFVSALILSHSQRNQYLQQALLNLSDERSRLDLDAKNRYLAVASHDLRQPLQAINMMSTQMCETSNDENLKKLNAASNALNNMFGQLLDASKINLDLMHVNIEPINLARFFEHIITPYKFSYAKKGINLHYDKIDAWVLSDYAGLQRIINNLLQNSLVHSGASDVYIKGVKDEDRFNLIIKDNGCGISDADKEAAFEEFIQLNTDHSNQGLGVGLSIVKKLIKELDHNMQLNSDHGCEFVISLPVCDSPVSNEKNSITQGNTVLIIEDDEKLMCQYKTWFENWGWDIAAANCLKQAMPLLERKPFLVMTDWNLPDGNAHTILNKIQNMMAYEPEVVVVSENDSLHKKINVANQYFVKPITASRLRAAIEIIA
jgi:signal transduction histidine kinase